MKLMNLTVGLFHKFNMKKPLSVYLLEAINIENIKSKVLSAVNYVMSSSCLFPDELLLFNRTFNCFSPCVSNNVTTETVNNSNSINFTATVGRYPNPFQLNFNISAVSTNNYIFYI